MVCLLFLLPGCVLVHGSPLHRSCVKCPLHLRRSTAKVFLCIGSVPSLFFQVADLLIDLLDAGVIPGLCSLLQVERPDELVEHERLERRLAPGPVVVDDDIFQAPGGGPLSDLGHDEHVQEHGRRLGRGAGPQFVVDRDAVGPGHGELEVDSNTLEDESRAAAGEEVVPGLAVGRIYMGTVIARPVAPRTSLT